MNSIIKRINNYILDNDIYLSEGISLVHSKSFFVRMFKSFTSFEGSIQRFKTWIIKDGKRVDIEYLNICHFENGKVNYYALFIENGYIRESDSQLNENFEKKLIHIDWMLSKYNSYSKYQYSQFVKQLKKDLKK